MGSGAPENTHIVRPQHPPRATGPLSRRPRRPLRALGPALPLAALATGGALILGGGWWWALDKAGAAVYERLRPWLQNQVGRVMGHPLELGPYAGVRPWGLAAGPSRFRPGADNPSTIDSAAVAVGLDPLRSLVERAWVLRIQVRDARVDLRRNSRGAYWELGRLPPGREPPRLGLRIELDGPAAVRLHPAVGAPIALQVEGASDLQLRRRDLSLSGLARPAAGGSLRFGLQSNWQQRQWQVQLLPHQLPAAPLLPFLPSGAQQQLIGRLQGRIDGQLRLRHGSGCQGALRLSGARWRAAVLPAPLQSEALPLRCLQDRLQLDSAAVAMGDWRGRLAGSFALSGPRSGDLKLQLQARESRRGHRLTAQLHGPWRRPWVDLQGSLQGLRLPHQPPLPVLLDGQLALRFQPRPVVQLHRLRLRRGDANLVAAGSLWPQLQVRTSQITPGQQLLRPLLPLLGIALVATAIPALMQSALPLDLVRGGLARAPQPQTLSALVIWLQLGLLLLVQWPVGQALARRPVAVGLALSLGLFSLGASLLALSALLQQGMVLVVLAQLPIALGEAAFLPTSTQAVVELSPPRHGGLAQEGAGAGLPRRAGVADGPAQPGDRAGSAHGVRIDGRQHLLGRVRRSGGHGAAARPMTRILLVEDNELNRKMVRQLARTVTAQKPLRPPLSACRRKLGNAMSWTFAAASSKPRMFSIRSTCCAFTPRRSPSSNRRFSPL